MLIGIKMKKIVTELPVGHSGRLKIYVSPSKIYVNPGLAFKSIQMTYSLKPLHHMVLKFHMQHDKAAGLQNNKIQVGRESIWPLLLKIAKPLKSTFPPEPLNIFG